MTPQEAIEILEMFLHKQCDLERTKFAYSENTIWIAVNMAKQAIEKQIPKKPNRTDWKDLPASQVLWKRDRISCPNCNWELLSTWDGGLRYCYHCGQALDWSDEE